MLAAQELKVQEGEEKRGASSEEMVELVRFEWTHQGSVGHCQRFCTTSKIKLLCPMRHVIQ